MKRLVLLALLTSLMFLACRFTTDINDLTQAGTAAPTLILPTAVGRAEDPTPEAIASVTPETTASVLSETPTATATQTATAAPTTAFPTATPTSTFPTPTPTVPTPTPCAIEEDWPVYVVQVGDTLFRIAQRAGSSVDELVAANCLTDRNQIRPGQILHVPNSIIDLTPFPTTIPDGDNVVIYPLADCLSAPFLFDAGVSTGERWKVASHLNILTVFDGRTSNNPIALLQKNESFSVLEGPYCYTKEIGLSLKAFRRWRISSETRPLTGWIDEYDVYTEATSITPDPKVIRFNVYPQVIHTGDPITIEWQVEGANEVHIFSYHSLHRFASGMVTQDPYLPPAGIITVKAPTPLTQVRYSLGFAPVESDRWATVNIICTEEFFVDVGNMAACPLGPMQTISAVFQPFERGFMVWRPDTSSNTIWVFVEAQPGSHIFLDTWSGEEITYDQQPPAGMVRPVRGFGKVWVENEWVRTSLGWATAEEQAYSMEIQKSQVGFASTVHLFSLPNGRLVNAGVYMGTSISWQYTTRR